LSIEEKPLEPNYTKLDFVFYDNSVEIAKNNVPKENMKSLMNKVYLEKEI
jgi:hypothetical protein